MQNILLEWFLTLVSDIRMQSETHHISNSETQSGTAISLLPTHQVNMIYTRWTSKRSKCWLTACRSDKELSGMLSLHRTVEACIIALSQAAPYTLLVHTHRSPPSVC